MSENTPSAAGDTGPSIDEVIASKEGRSTQLKRKLSGRHMRMIAIGGGTSVTHSIKESGTHYASIYPMQTFREWTRNAVHLNHLNEMHKRIKALEAQLAEQHGK